MEEQVTTGSSTTIQINGVVDPSTIKIDGGDKDFSQVVLGNGGRGVKQDPEKEITVEFDAYTTGISTADANTQLGFEQYFAGNTYDTTEASGGLTANNTRTRKKFRLTMLKSETFSTNASATAAVTGSASAKRLSIANMQMTGIPQDYADFVWKVHVKFKAPPYKKDGTANVQFQSHDGSDTTSGLPALANYTTSTNF